MLLADFIFEKSEADIVEYLQNNPKKKFTYLPSYQEVRNKSKLYKKKEPILDLIIRFTDHTNLIKKMLFDKYPISNEMATNLKCAHFYPELTSWIKSVFLINNKFIIVTDKWLKMNSCFVDEPNYINGHIINVKKDTPFLPLNNREQLNKNLKKPIIKKQINECWIMSEELDTSSDGTSED